MSRNTKRVAFASLVLGLGLAGTATAGARVPADLDDIFATNDVERVFQSDLPAITGDIESGLGGLLGDQGLLGGILGGTGGLLDGLLGGLGLGSDPELEIQPIPSGENSFDNPNVGGGLLDGLFGINSLTESLAGHL